MNEIPLPLSLIQLLNNAILCNYLHARAAHFFFPHFLSARPFYISTDYSHVDLVSLRRHICVGSEEVTG